MNNSLLQQSHIVFKVRRKCKTILFWSVKKWIIFNLQPYSLPSEDDVCPIRGSRTLYEFT